MWCSKYIWKIILTHLNLIWLAIFSKVRSNKVHALPTAQYQLHILSATSHTHTLPHQICAHLPSCDHTPPAHLYLHTLRHMCTQMLTSSSKPEILHTFVFSLLPILNHAAVLGHSLLHQLYSRWNGCGQKRGLDSLPRKDWECLS